jgi:hypothetical protein
MRNNLDKIFDEKLNAYSSHVSENIWSNIHMNLPQHSANRNKRWIFLLLLFIGVSIAGSLIYYYKQFQNNSSADESIVQAVEQNFAGSLLKPTANSVETNIGLGHKETVQTDQSNHNLTGNPVSGPKSGRGVGLVLGESDLLEDRTISFTENIDDESSTNEQGAETLASTIQNKRFADKRTLLMTPADLGRRSTFVYSNQTVRRSKSKTLGDCFEEASELYFISFNVSMDYPFRSLFSANIGEIQNYIVNRENTESGLVSFSAGITGGYIHPRGWKAETGIQYTQLNEKFLFVKENVIKIQTQITIDTMYNGDGTYTIHRDTTSIEVLGFEEMKTSNHYKMLDIPLIFGYNFYFKNIGIEANAGFIFNVASSSSGRIFNPDLIPSYYGKKTNGSFLPYRMRFGTSFYGSLSLKTTIKGHTQFYFEPNARYYLRSFSSSSNPVNQKYFVLGLSSGIRYYF